MLNPYNACDEPTLIARHDPHHEQRDRAEAFDRIRQMLTAAIAEEGHSTELAFALQHIRTGFLWIAEHHRRS